MVNPKIIATVAMVDSHTIVVAETTSFNPYTHHDQVAICMWADQQVLAWQARMVARGLTIELDNNFAPGKCWPNPLRHGQGIDATVPYAMAYNVEANNSEDVFTLAVYDLD